MALHKLTDLDEYVQLLARERRRGAGALAGHPDPRDALLPRARGVRGCSRSASSPRSLQASATSRRSGSGCRAARPARRRTPRDRPARVLGDAPSDPPSRSSPPTSARRPSSTRGPGSTRRHRRRRLAGAAAPLLHQGRRRLPDQASCARPLRLRPAGPHARPAVLAARPDRLPQRADLPRAALQKKLMHVFHYALQAGRLPDAGSAETVGHRRSTCSPSPTRSTASTQEERRDAAMPSTSHRSSTPQRGRTPRRAAERRRAGERPARAGEADRLILDATRRRAWSSTTTSDRPVPRPDRPVPRAGPGRGEPEPAQDGARGAAARAAHGAPQAPRERSRCVREAGYERPHDGSARARERSRSCPLTRRAAAMPLPRAVRGRRRRRRARRQAAARRRRAGASGAATAPRASRQLAARSCAATPRVPAVDHPGPRGGERGAAVGERGDPLQQRGAAEHQRGARHRARRSCSPPTRSSTRSTRSSTAATRS